MEFICYFLKNFLARVGLEWNLERKFFFLSFWAYLNPIWIEIVLKRCFLIFKLFCYVFWNFLGRVRNEFRNENFSLFLGLSQPGLDRNIVRMMLFSFLNFFLFVLELSSPGRVGMEFGTKIFFSLSRPISGRIG